MAPGISTATPRRAPWSSQRPRPAFTGTEMQNVCPRTQEIPFDSDRKRMTTIHRSDGTDARFPSDGIFRFTRHRLRQGGAGHRSGSLRPRPAKRPCRRSDGGETQGDPGAEPRYGQQRPPGARRRLPAALLYAGSRKAAHCEEIEKELTFVGLVGMIDPARPEVLDAVKLAKEAGLKSIMVTGDYRDTAEAIAGEIGLLTPGGLVLTGAELDRMSDAGSRGQGRQG